MSVTLSDISIAQLGQLRECFEAFTEGRPLPLQPTRGVSTSLRSKAPRHLLNNTNTKKHHVNTITNSEVGQSVPPHISEEEEKGVKIGSGLPSASLEDTNTNMKKEKSSYGIGLDTEEDYEDFRRIVEFLSRKEDNLDDREDGSGDAKAAKVPDSTSNGPSPLSNSNNALSKGKRGSRTFSSSFALKSDSSMQKHNQSQPNMLPRLPRPGSRGGGSASSVAGLSAVEAHVRPQSGVSFEEAPLTAASAAPPKINNTTAVPSAVEGRRSSSAHERGVLTEESARQEAMVPPVVSSPNLARTQVNLDQFVTIWNHVLGEDASSPEMLSLLFHYIDDNDDGLVSWYNVFTVVENARNDEAKERLRLSHQKDEVSLRAEEEANTQNERRQAVLRKLKNSKSQNGTVSSGGSSSNKKKALPGEVENDLGDDELEGEPSHIEPRVTSESHFFFPVSEELGVETLAKETQHSDTITRIFGTYVNPNPAAAMAKMRSYYLQQREKAERRRKQEMLLGITSSTSISSVTAAPTASFSQQTGSVREQEKLANGGAVSSGELSPTSTPLPQQEGDYDRGYFNPLAFAALMSPVPSPTDVYITAGSDGHVKLWQSATKEFITTLHHNPHGGVDCYYCNKSGLLAVSSCDYSVALYDVSSRKLLKNFVVGRESDMVFRQQFRAPVTMNEEVTMSDGRPPPGPVPKNSVMYRQWRQRQKHTMADRMWSYAKVIDEFKATPLAQIQTVTAVAVHIDPSGSARGGGRSHDPDVFLFLGDENGTIWIFRTKTSENGDDDGNEKGKDGENHIDSPSGRPRSPSATLRRKSRSSPPGGRKGSIAFSNTSQQYVSGTTKDSSQRRGEGETSNGSSPSGEDDDEGLEYGHHESNDNDKEQDDRSGNKAVHVGKGLRSALSLTPVKQSGPNARRNTSQGEHNHSTRRAHSSVLLPPLSSTPSGAKTNPDALSPFSTSSSTSLFGRKRLFDRRPLSTTSSKSENGGNSQEGKIKERGGGGPFVSLSPSARRERERDIAKSNSGAAGLASNSSVSGDKTNNSSTFSNQRKKDGSFVGFQPIGSYTVHSGAIRQLMILEDAELSSSSSSSSASVLTSATSFNEGKTHVGGVVVGVNSSPQQQPLLVSSSSSTSAGTTTPPPLSAPKRNPRETLLASLAKLRVISASADSDVHVTTPDSGSVLKTFHGTKNWTLQSHSRGVKGFAWNDKRLMRTVTPSSSSATGASSDSGSKAKGTAASTAASSASASMLFTSSAPPSRHAPMMATWGAERHVILWDPATGRAVDALYASSRITSVCFVSPPYRPNLEVPSSANTNLGANNNASASALATTIQSQEPQLDSTDCSSSSGDAPVASVNRGGSAPSQQLMILVMTEDKMIRLWDIANLSCLQQMRDYSVCSGAGAVFYDPLRENAISCTARLNLWRSIKNKEGATNGAGGISVGSSSSSQTHSQPVTHQHHWLREKILVTADAASLRLWSSETGATLSAWPMRSLQGFAADDSGAYALIQAAEPSSVSADAVFRAQHEATCDGGGSTGNKNANITSNAADTVSSAAKRVEASKKGKKALGSGNSARTDGLEKDFNEEEELGPKFSTSAGATSSCLQVIDSNKGQIVEVLVGSSRDSSFCDLQFLFYKGRWIVVNSEHILVYNTQLRDDENGVAEKTVSPFGDVWGEEDYAPNSSSSPSPAGGAGKATGLSSPHDLTPKTKGGQPTRRGGPSGTAAPSSLDIGTLSNASHKFRWPVMRRSIKSSTSQHQAHSTATATKAVPNSSSMHSHHVSALAICDDYIVMGHENGDVSSLAFMNLARSATSSSSSSLPSSYGGGRSDVNCIPRLRRLSEAASLTELVAGSAAAVVTSRRPIGVQKNSMMATPASAAQSAPVQQPVIVPSCADLGRVNACEYASVLLGPIHAEPRQLIKKSYVQQQRMQQVQTRERELQKKRSEALKATAAARGESSLDDRAAGNEDLVGGLEHQQGLNSATSTQKSTSGGDLKKENHNEEEQMPPGLGLAASGTAGLLFDQPYGPSGGSHDDKNKSVESGSDNERDTRLANENPLDPVAMAGSGSRIELMTALHEGSYVVTADSDGVLSLWNLAPFSVQVVRWLPTFGASTAITALATMPLPLRPAHVPAEYAYPNGAENGGKNNTPSTNLPPYLSRTTRSLAGVSTVYYADEEGYIGAFEICTEGITAVLKGMAGGTTSNDQSPPTTANTCSVEVSEQPNRQEGEFLSTTGVPSLKGTTRSFLTLQTPPSPTLSDTKTCSKGKEGQTNGANSNSLDPIALCVIRTLVCRLPTTRGFVRIGQTAAAAEGGPISSKGSAGNSGDVPIVPSSVAMASYLGSDASSGSTSSGDGNSGDTSPSSSRRFVTSFSWIVQRSVWACGTSTGEVLMLTPEGLLVASLGRSLMPKTLPIRQSPVVRDDEIEMGAASYKEFLISLKRQRKAAVSGGGAESSNLRDLGSQGQEAEESLSTSFGSARSLQSTKTSFEELLGNTTGGGGGGSDEEILLSYADDGNTNAKDASRRLRGVPTLSFYAPRHLLSLSSGSQGSSATAMRNNHPSFVKVVGEGAEEDAPFPCTSCEPARVPLSYGHQLLLDMYRREVLMRVTDVDELANASPTDILAVFGDVLMSSSSLLVGPAQVEGVAAALAESYRWRLLSLFGNLDVVFVGAGRWFNNYCSATTAKSTASTAKPLRPVPFDYLSHTQKEARRAKLASDESGNPARFEGNVSRLLKALDSLSPSPAPADPYRRRIALSLIDCALLLETLSASARTSAVALPLMLTPSISIHNTRLLDLSEGRYACLEEVEKGFSVAALLSRYMGRGGQKRSVFKDGSASAERQHSPTGVSTTHSHLMAIVPLGSAAVPLALVSSLASSFGGTLAARDSSFGMATATDTASIGGMIGYGGGLAAGISPGILASLQPGSSALPASVLVKTKGRGGNSNRTANDSSDFTAAVADGPIETRRRLSTHAAFIHELFGLEPLSKTLTLSSSSRIARCLLTNASLTSLSQHHAKIYEHLLPARLRLSFPPQQSLLKERRGRAESEGKYGITTQRQNSLGTRASTFSGEDCEIYVSLHIVFNSQLEKIKQFALGEMSGEAARRREHIAASAATAREGKSMESLLVFGNHHEEDTKNKGSTLVENEKIFASTDEENEKSELGSTDRHFDSIHKQEKEHREALMTKEERHFSVVIDLISSKMRVLAAVVLDKFLYCPYTFRERVYRSPMVPGVVRGHSAAVAGQLRNSGKRELGGYLLRGPDSENEEEKGTALPPFVSDFIAKRKQTLEQSILLILASSASSSSAVTNARLKDDESSSSLAEKRNRKLEKYKNELLLLDSMISSYSTTTTTTTCTSSSAKKDCEGVALLHYTPLLAQTLPVLSELGRSYFQSDPSNSYSSKRLKWGGGSSNSKSSKRDNELSVQNGNDKSLRFPRANSAPPCCWAGEGRAQQAQETRGRSPMPLGPLFVPSSVVAPKSSGGLRSLRKRSNSNPSERVRRTIVSQTDAASFWSILGRNFVDGESSPDWTLKWVSAVQIVDLAYHLAAGNTGSGGLGLGEGIPNADQPNSGKPTDQGGSTSSIAHVLRGGGMALGASSSSGGGGGGGGDADVKSGTSRPSSVSSASSADTSTAAALISKLMSQSSSLMASYQSSTVPSAVDPIDGTHEPPAVQIALALASGVAEAFEHRCGSIVAMLSNWRDEVARRVVRRRKQKETPLGDANRGSSSSSLSPPTAANSRFSFSLPTHMYGGDLSIFLTPSPIAAITAMKALGETISMGSKEADTDVTSNLRDDGDKEYKKERSHLNSQVELDTIESLERRKRREEEDLKRITASAGNTNASNKKSDKKKTDRKDGETNGDDAHESHSDADSSFGDPSDLIAAEVDADSVFLSSVPRTPLPAECSLSSHVALRPVLLRAQINSHDTMNINDFFDPCGLNGGANSAADSVNIKGHAVSSSSDPPLECASYLANGVHQWFVPEENILITRVTNAEVRWALSVQTKKRQSFYPSSLSSAANSSANPSNPSWYDIIKTAVQNEVKALKCLNDAQRDSGGDGAVPRVFTPLVSVVEACGDLYVCTSAIPARAPCSRRLRDVKAISNTHTVSNTSCSEASLPLINAFHKPTIASALTRLALNTRSAHPAFSVERLFDSSYGGGWEEDEDEACDIQAPMSYANHQLAANPNGLLLLCGGFGRLPLYPSEPRANDGDSPDKPLFTAPALRTEIMSGLPLPLHGSEEMIKTLSALHTVASGRAMWPPRQLSKGSLRLFTSLTSVASYHEEHDPRQLLLAPSSAHGHPPSKRLTRPSLAMSAGVGGGGGQPASAGLLRKTASVANLQMLMSRKSGATETVFGHNYTTKESISHIVHTEKERFLSYVSEASALCATAYLTHPASFRACCPPAVKRSVERLATRTLKRIESVLVPKVAQFMRQREATIIASHRDTFRKREEEKGEGLGWGYVKSQQMRTATARQQGTGVTENYPLKSSERQNSSGEDAVHPTSAYLADRPLLLALAPSLGELLHRHGANLKHLGLTLAYLNQDEEKIMSHRLALLDLAAQHEQHLSHELFGAKGKDEGKKGPVQQSSPRVGSGKIGFAGSSIASAKLEAATSSSFLSSVWQRQEGLQSPGGPSNYLATFVPPPPPAACEVSMYPSNRTAGASLMKGGVGFAGHTASWYVCATEILARTVAAAVREDILLINSTKPFSIERTKSPFVVGRVTFVDLVTAGEDMMTCDYVFDRLRASLFAADALTLGPSGVFDIVLQYWLLMVFEDKAEAALRTNDDEETRKRERCEEKKISSSALPSSSSFSGSYSTRTTLKEGSSSEGGIGSGTDAEQAKMRADTIKSIRREELKWWRHAVFQLMERKFPTERQVATTAGSQEGGGKSSSPNASGTSLSDHNVSGGSPLRELPHGVGDAGRERNDLKHQQQQQQLITRYSDFIPDPIALCSSNGLLSKRIAELLSLKDGIAIFSHQAASENDQASLNGEEKGKPKGAATGGSASNRNHLSKLSAAAATAQNTPAETTTQVLEVSASEFVTIGMLRDFEERTVNNTYLDKKETSSSKKLPSSKTSSSSTTTESLSTDPFLLGALLTSSAMGSFSGVGLVSAPAGGLYTQTVRVRSGGASQFAARLSRPPNWSWIQQNARIAAEDAARKALLTMWPSSSMKSKASADPARAGSKETASVVYLTEVPQPSTSTLILSAAENDEVATKRSSSSPLRLDTTGASSGTDLVPDHRYKPLTALSLISHPRSTELLYLLYCCDSGNVPTPENVTIPNVTTINSSLVFSCAEDCTTNKAASCLIFNGPPAILPNVVVPPSSLYSVDGILRRSIAAVANCKDADNRFASCVSLPSGVDFYPKLFFPTVVHRERVVESEPDDRRGVVLSRCPNVMTVLAKLVEAIDFTFMSSNSTSNNGHRGDRTSHSNRALDDGTMSTMTANVSSRERKGPSGASASATQTVKSHGHHQQQQRKAFSPNASDKSPAFLSFAHPLALLTIALAVQVAQRNDSNGRAAVAPLAARALVDRCGYTLRHTNDLTPPLAILKENAATREEGKISASRNSTTEMKSVCEDTNATNSDDPVVNFRMFLMKPKDMPGEALFTVPSTAKRSDALFASSIRVLSEFDRLKQTVNHLSLTADLSSPSPSTIASPLPFLGDDKDTAATAANPSRPHSSIYSHTTPSPLMFGDQNREEEKERNLIMLPSSSSYPSPSLSPSSSTLLQTKTISVREGDGEKTFSGRSSVMRRPSEHISQAMSMSTSGRAFSSAGRTHHHDDNDDEEISGEKISVSMAVSARSHQNAHVHVRHQQNQHQHPKGPTTHWHTVQQSYAQHNRKPLSGDIHRSELDLAHSYRQVMPPLPALSLLPTAVGILFRTTASADPQVAPGSLSAEELGRSRLPAVSKRLVSPRGGGVGGDLEEFRNGDEDEDNGDNKDSGVKSPLLSPKSQTWSPSSSPRKPAAALLRKGEDEGKKKDTKTSSRGGGGNNKENKDKDVSGKEEGARGLAPTTAPPPRRPTFGTSSLGDLSLMAIAKQWVQTTSNCENLRAALGICGSRKGGAGVAAISMNDKRVNTIPNHSSFSSSSFAPSRRVVVITSTFLHSLLRLAHLHLSFEGDVRAAEDILLLVKHHLITCRDEAKLSGSESAALSQEAMLLEMRLATAAEGAGAAEFSLKFNSYFKNRRYGGVDFCLFPEHLADVDSPASCLGEALANETESASSFVAPTTVASFLPNGFFSAQNTSPKNAIGSSGTEANSLTVREGASEEEALDTAEDATADSSPSRGPRRADRGSGTGGLDAASRIISSQIALPGGSESGLLKARLLLSRALSMVLMVTTGSAVVTCSGKFSQAASPRTGLGAVMNNTPATASPIIYSNSNASRPPETRPTALDITSDAAFHLLASAVSLVEEAMRITEPVAVATSANLGKKVPPIPTSTKNGESAGSAASPQLLSVGEFHSARTSMLASVRERALKQMKSEDDKEKDGKNADHPPDYLLIYDDDDSLYADAKNENAVLVSETFSPTENRDRNTGTRRGRGKGVRGGENARSLTIGFSVSHTSKARRAEALVEIALRMVATSSSPPSYRQGSVSDISLGIPLSSSWGLSYATSHSIASGVPLDAFPPHTFAHSHNAGSSGSCCGDALTHFSFLRLHAELLHLKVRLAMLNASISMSHHLRRFAMRSEELLALQTLAKAGQPPMRGEKNPTSLSLSLSTTAGLVAAYKPFLLRDPAPRLSIQNAIQIAETVAIPALTAFVELSERAWGPLHPLSALGLINVGMLFSEIGNMRGLLCDLSYEESRQISALTNTLQDWMSGKRDIVKVGGENALSLTSHPVSSPTRAMRLSYKSASGQLDKDVPASRSLQEDASGARAFYQRAVHCFSVGSRLLTSAAGPSCTLPLSAVILEAEALVSSGLILEGFTKMTRTVAQIETFVTSGFDHRYHKNNRNGVRHGSILTKLVTSRLILLWATAECSVASIMMHAANASSSQPSSQPQHQQQRFSSTFAIQNNQDVLRAMRIGDGGPGQHREARQHVINAMRVIVSMGLATGVRRAAFVAGTASLNVNERGEPRQMVQASPQRSQQRAGKAFHECTNAQRKCVDFLKLSSYAHLGAADTDTSHAAAARTGLREEVGASSSVASNSKAVNMQLQDLPPEVAAVLAFLRLLASLLEHEMIVSGAEGEEATARARRERLLNRWAQRDTDTGPHAAKSSNTNENNGSIGQSNANDDARSKSVAMRPVYLLK